MDLIPTEHHFYSLADAARGVVAARRRSPKPAVLALPGVGEGLSIRSARAAVIVILESLDLPAGSEIGVPLYCCPVVFKAVRAAGCVPRFIDIDTRTYCLSTEDLESKRNGLSAVIAVHMYGFLCDMPEVLRIMAGRPVIEDCAQSLGSRLDGRSCGTFGDAAFFSFRSGKYLAIGEGAAIHTRRADLRARLAALAKALPAPSTAAEIKHIGETYVRSKLRGRALWGPLGTRVWAVYNRKTEFADKSPIVVSRMFDSDVAILRKRLPRLDVWIGSQRAHAAAYERDLRLEPALLPREDARMFLNRFMFPILLPSPEERVALAGRLKRLGIGTATPYEDTVEGASRHYGYRGDCPSAERALKATLVIPVSHALRIRDIARITRGVNESWAKVGGPRPD